jgi:hypothetical protein
VASSRASGTSCGRNDLLPVSVRIQRTEHPSLCTSADDSEARSLRPAQKSAPELPSPFTESDQRVKPSLSARPRRNVRRQDR